MKVNPGIEFHMASLEIDVFDGNQKIAINSEAIQGHLS
jgi:hypothetical protein